MGVQMCHHCVKGHFLDNSSSRLQKINYYHQEGGGQLVEANHHPALGVHVFHQSEHQLIGKVKMLR